MGMRRIVTLGATHAIALAIGFAAGVYALPLIVAPDAPAAAIETAAARATHRTAFRRDLPGSDALHWGEGAVFVGPDAISLRGRLAPGPDYKLYLVRGTVETGEQFVEAKRGAIRIGDVKTFDGFHVPVPPGVDVADYDTVLVWCERFSQFITSARYRN